MQSTPPGHPESLPMRMPIQRKLFFSHFLAVILISGSIGTYFYLAATESLMASLKSRLQSSAALVSRILEADELARIRGPEAVDLPVYRYNLALLRELRRTNPDIAYLYVMRREGERVSFVLDSDDTEGQALPGREYHDVVPSLLRGFEAPTVDAEITVDEWGAFLSGYAPVAGAQGTLMVGIDMRADEVHEKFRKIRLTGVVSLAVSLLLAALFSRLLSGHFIQPIRVLIQRCTDIAEGRLRGSIALTTGDELDNLIVAYNDMTLRLRESHEQSLRAEAALTRARDELESRVAERTKDLIELNGQLMREIGERKKAEEALARAAKTDPLTGLMNRRAMLDHLDYQRARTERSRIPFAVVLGDVDHFKRINDTLGHDVGDRVLAEVARRLRAVLRAQDLVARWGGEEFLLVLPETDLPGGLHAAEKVRAAIGDSPFAALDEGLPVNMSLGVALFAAGRSVDRALKAADDALYRAKRGGRDRVEAEEA
jgi:diguanylate cyclase (GGDEF)-like protein